MKFTGGGGHFRRSLMLRRGNGNEPSVSAFCSLSICIRHLPASPVGGERTGEYGEERGLKDAVGRHCWELNVPALSVLAILA